MSYPSAIVDIGTSKAVCLLGGKGDSGLMELYGTGCHEHAGLRKGLLTKQETVRDAAMDAIQDASEESKRSISSICIGVPDAMIQTICQRIVMPLETRRKIKEEDLDALIEFALKDRPMERSWIHLNSHVERFEIDHSTFKNLPIGTMTKEITGVVSNTFFRKDFEDLMKSTMKEMDIGIEAFIDSMYAQAMLVLPEDRRNRDAVLIDVGYYQTSLLILRNEAPIYRKHIEIGGYHIANDIRYVLDVSPKAAEDLKRRHVFGLDYMEQIDTYQRADGTWFECEYDMIQNIIEARTLEMAEMLMIELNKSPIQIDKNTIISITGGGILMMRGGREFLQSAMEIPLIAAHPVLPKRNSPNFYSAYGVLEYCLECNRVQKNGRWGKSIMRSIVDFFTK